MSAPTPSQELILKAIEVRLNKTVTMAEDASESIEKSQAVLDKANASIASIRSDKAKVEQAFGIESTWQAATDGGPTDQPN